MEWSLFWTIVAQVFLAWLAVLLIVLATRNAFRAPPSKREQTEPRESRFPRQR